MPNKKFNKKPQSVTEASSSVYCDNSAAISPEHATSLSLSPTPIRTSKPRERGRIWDNIVSNIQTSNAASPVLKERSKASIQQKWDAVFQKYRY
ncbi:hypothetical protein RhiirA1_458414 [Rhizophagus irregularis]|uniref:Uncharacterized protein n=1 Tax=Rhizophagus irregularis TaxID=588596 RepID=A0A2N0RVX2_9GLOM|nr:hypothetical protein RhiirA1_458414 [Rhizophagus irregularis]CAB4491559.1 unnamed protein product [Rhizophagus irregularis]